MRFLAQPNGTLGKTVTTKPGDRLNVRVRALRKSGPMKPGDLISITSIGTLRKSSEIPSLAGYYLALIRLDLSAGLYSGLTTGTGETPANHEIVSLYPGTLADYDAGSYGNMGCLQYLIPNSDNTKLLSWVSHWIDPGVDTFLEFSSGRPVTIPIGNASGSPSYAEMTNAIDGMGGYIPTPAYWLDQINASTRAISGSTGYRGGWNGTTWDLIDSYPLPGVGGNYYIIGQGSVFAKTGYLYISRPWWKPVGASYFPMMGLYSRDSGGTELRVFDGMDFTEWDDPDKIMGAGFRAVDFIEGLAGVRYFTGNVSLYAAAFNTHIGLFNSDFTQGAWLWSTAGGDRIQYPGGYPAMCFFDGDLYFVESWYPSQAHSPPTHLMKHPGSLPASSGNLIESWALTKQTAIVPGEPDITPAVDNLCIHGGLLYWGVNFDRLTGQNWPTYYNYRIFNPQNIPLIYALDTDGNFWHVAINSTDDILSIHQIAEMNGELYATAVVYIRG